MIGFHGRKINRSHVFAGRNVGVTQVGDRIWLVTFMHDDSGYFDDEVGRLEPIETRSARECYLCARNNPLTHVTGKYRGRVKDQIVTTWNPMIDWLKRIDRLRSAAWE